MLVSAISASNRGVEPHADRQRKRGRTSDPLPQLTTASTQIPGVQIRKRRRTAAGKLAGIMELPMELFFEVRCEPLVSRLSVTDVPHPDCLDRLSP